MMNLNQSPLYDRNGSDSKDDETPNVDDGVDIMSSRDPRDLWFCEYSDALVLLRLKTGMRKKGDKRNTDTDGDVWIWSRWIYLYFVGHSDKGSVVYIRNVCKPIGSLIHFCNAANVAG